MSINKVSDRRGRASIIKARVALLVVLVALPQCRSTRPETPERPVVAPRRYTCQRASQRPVIDGRLDEPVWRSAQATQDFVGIEGLHTPPPPYATRARLLWDGDYLYVAAELQDPAVRARLTRRDDVVYHDNDFEVFLDPDGDARHYIEIEINALNTVFDLLLERTYREGGPARREWNVEGLVSAVSVDGTLNDPSDVDRGWFVEMAIPWSAIAPYAKTPCPPRAGDVWRMNFSRVQWPHGVQGGPELVRKGIESNWVWTPQGVVDMHIPQHWGFVEFSDEVVTICDESPINRPNRARHGAGIRP